LIDQPGIFGSGEELQEFYGALAMGTAGVGPGGTAENGIGRRTFGKPGNEGATEAKRALQRIGDLRRFKTSLPELRNLLFIGATESNKCPLSGNDHAKVPGPEVVEAPGPPSALSAQRVKFNRGGHYAVLVDHVVVHLQGGAQFGVARDTG